MLEKSKKITKKQIKEDKLVTTYYTVKNFVLENQARILIGAAAVALVIVAGILFAQKAMNDNKKAAALLAKVVPLYEATAYKEAIDGQPSTNTTGLKSIVDEYGGSDNGETAKIYLGNAYLMLGKSNEAFEAFDSYSGSNELFKASAMAGKAGILEARKELEKAYGLYQDAANVSKSNPANSDYLLRAGVIMLNLGKKEDAKNVFDLIKKEYKNTMAAAEVEKYLIQIES